MNRLNRKHVVLALRVRFSQFIVNFEHFNALIISILFEGAEKDLIITRRLMATHLKYIEREENDVSDQFMNFRNILPEILRIR